MDPQERARRMNEKAQRKPNNPTVLDVQNGFISTHDVIKHIEKNLPRIIKEQKNGKIS